METDYIIAVFYITIAMIIVDVPNIKSNAEGVTDRKRIKKTPPKIFLLLARYHMYL